MLIDAIVEFEQKPTMRSVLMGANATIHCTGEESSLQQDHETFSENWSLANNWCFALMNVALYALGL